MQGRGPPSSGTFTVAGCGTGGWSRARRVANRGLQPTADINLFKIGTFLPVPFGTFPGVPSLLAFRGSACLLPLAKPRVRNEPFPANPTGSLLVSALLSHRFLLLVTFWKTVVYFLADREEKWGGSDNRNDKLYDDDQMGPFSVPGWVHPSSINCDIPRVIISFIPLNSHFRSPRSYFFFF